ncbi:MAG: hypothetical protein ACSLFB_01740 [Acidimicrobiales bacterium]
MNDQPSFEPPEWHVSPRLMRDYVALKIDMARSASVEQHLLSCPNCQVALSSFVYADVSSAANLDALWLDVIDAVDRPSSGLVGSTLRLLGVSDHVARLIAAAPAMHLSWIASVVLVLGFAISYAMRPYGSDALLLVLAPLIPLAGIGTAYGLGNDRLYELTKVSPLSSSRVFLYRSLAVLCTATPLTLTAALIMRLDGLEAMGWLLPSLGLVGLTLALSTWVQPLIAAISVGTTWIILVVGVWARSARLEGIALETTVIFQPTGQIAFAVVALVAAVLFIGRLGHLDTPVDSHRGAW